VNAFTIAGFALILGFVPLGALCLVAREIDGVVALELCGVLATLAFLCLAEGFHRSAYFDVPVICAVATWIGGVVFVRFFGRFI
jgi:multisubunit Na+/H+ antiporter MnhF subunit